MSEDRAINRISESGMAMTIAQSLQLFPAFDEAALPHPFAVSKDLVVHLRFHGRWIFATDIKASKEEGFYFGTHNGARLGFEPHHVFAEGLPEREVRPLQPHHALEARRLTLQGHTTASIAKVLRVSVTEIELALGTHPEGDLQSKRTA